MTIKKIETEEEDIMKGASKQFPLYVSIISGSKRDAWLHHGSATTIDEGVAKLQELQAQPVHTVLEITSCRMFEVEIKEVTEDFCPACGLTGRDAGDCNCPH